mmetsp:Transcript_5791/g.20193  ORF Transcript_5791/g.20193 Transcript_5791/m.20193 type:complete len:493 (+) Transcript_5791:475-1953(+)
MRSADFSCTTSLRSAAVVANSASSSSTRPLSCPLSFATCAFSPARLPEVSLILSCAACSSFSFFSSCERRESSCLSRSSESLLIFLISLILSCRSFSRSATFFSATPRSFISFESFSCAASMSLRSFSLSRSVFSRFLRSLRSAVISVDRSSIFFSCSSAFASIFAAHFWLLSSSLPFSVPSCLEVLSSSSSRSFLSFSSYTFFSARRRAPSSASKRRRTTSRACTLSSTAAFAWLSWEMASRITCCAAPSRPVRSQLAGSCSSSSWGASDWDLAVLYSASISLSSSSSCFCALSSPSTTCRLVTSSSYRPLNLVDDASSCSSFSFSLRVFSSSSFTLLRYESRSSSITTSRLSRRAFTCSWSVVRRLYMTSSFALARLRPDTSSSRALHAIAMPFSSFSSFALRLSCSVCFASSSPLRRIWPSRSPSVRASFVRVSASVLFVSPRMRTKFSLAASVAASLSCVLLSSTSVSLRSSVSRVSSAPRRATSALE